MATPFIDPQVSRPAPGWFTDPSGRYELRWWNGLGWSAYARTGNAQFYAPLFSVSLPSDGPGGHPADWRTDELAHLEYLEHFLDQAGTDHAITAADYGILKARMAARRDPLVAQLLAAGPATAAGRSTEPPGVHVPRVPAGSPASALLAQVSAAAPAPPAAPPAGPAMPPARQELTEAAQAPPRVQPAASPQPARREPGLAGRWLQRTGETVRSDLAVNGLAYLGVLLLFAGLFGVVAFSFSSVGVALRPVAEVVVPTAIFGSAWLLGRRNLVVPARALALLGGLLVLVAGLAAFADEAPVPPDLTGVPMVVALTATPIATAVAYAAWSRRHRSSPLRHLVVPALWLAVGMAALGWRKPIPFGQDIVIPQPWQYAAILAAITISLAASRRWAGRTQMIALYPAGLAGLGIAALVEGVTAGAAGWPGAPLAVSGAATVLALDVSDQQIPSAPLAVLQSLVIALTAIALVPALGVGWAGAIATMAGVATVERTLRRAAPGSVLFAPIVVAVAGVVMTGVATAIAVTGRSGLALLAASAIGSAWAQARRLWPGRWPYPAWLLTVAAATAPAGVVAGLLAALPVGVGAAVAGLAMLCGGVSVRIMGRPDDRFWSWWIPAAAVAVLAATLAEGGTVWHAVAAGAATGAIAISPVVPTLRVWLTGVAVLWTAWLVFDIADVGFGARMLGIAGAATVAVGVATLRQDAWAGHAGLLGHLAGLVSWPLAAVHAGSVEAVAPTAVLGLIVTGTTITTVAEEVGRSTVTNLLVRAGTRLSAGLTDRGRAAVEAALRQVPATAAALLLLAFVLDIAALSGLSVPAPWRPLALSALAVSYLLLARALRARRRVARVLADVGTGAVLLAAVLCQQRAPALMALAAVIAAPVLLGPALRRLAVIWIAWVASVPFAVLAAELFGLPASSWYAVTLGWGALMLLSDLASERAGWHWPAARTRKWWQAPPVVVGAVASAAGLIGSAGGTGQQPGWALIAAGAVVAAVGVLVRIGALGGVGAAMAVAGLSAVAKAGLTDHPWLLLAVAAVLLIAADVTSARTAADAELWRRWDLPLFVVAHGVAVFAIGLSVASGNAVAETVAGGGGLALAVAARLRRWSWAVGGTVLILAGAGDAGAGWECLALVAASVTATALAVPRQGRARAALQVAGAVGAVGAWAAGLTWRDASFAVAVQASAAGAGALVLVAGAGTRISRAVRDWARAWGGVGLAVTAAAAVALINPGVPPDARLVVAGALAASAIGCGLAAGPMDIAWLRETAGIAVIASGVVLANGTSAGLTALGWGAIVAGLIAAGIVLAPWTRRTAEMWMRPAVLVAVSATLTALAAGVLALPDRALMVPALVLTAVVIVALAVWLRRQMLAAVTPVPLCAAWLAYASEALTGQPQWFTVPVGVAIIGVAGLLRSARRAAGRPVAAPDVAALEITGMGLVMGASLVQAVTAGPLFGLIGAGLATALMCWGALTRVRRRLAGGAIAVSASVLLLVVVPLVRLVPHWGGVAAWLILAGVGLIAIVVAALLDASRAAVRRGAARLSELTSGWE